MLELFDAGLLAERGAESAGDWLFVVRVWRLRASGVELVEDEQVTVWIVHGWNASVVANLAQYRFRPGMKDGRQVAVEMVVNQMFDVYPGLR